MYSVEVEIVHDKSPLVIDQLTFHSLISGGLEINSIFSTIWLGVLMSGSSIS